MKCEIYEKCIPKTTTANLCSNAVEYPIFTTSNLQTVMFLKEAKQQKNVVQESIQDTRAVNSYSPVVLPRFSGKVVSKGQRVSLSCQDITVGVSWDLSQQGRTYDMDVEVFLLDTQERVIGDDWFVFFNQEESPDKAVTFLGGNAKRHEKFHVDFNRLDKRVSKLLFVLTINDAKVNKQAFDKVENAKIRLYDNITKTDILEFEITEYYANVYSMMLGEVYNYKGTWKFNAIGDGTQDDLYGLCHRYGVVVE